MQGGPNAGGGALKIVSAGGGNFDFAALDFAAIDFSGAGSQTLMIEGFLGGLPVGTDQYTLANTANIPFTNWTTEAASVLAGKTISELDIELNAGNSPTTFAESIDNVVLTPVSAPVAEPASLALLAAGLPGLGLVSRRKA
jgi:hypothetical protein